MKLIDMKLNDTTIKSYKNLRNDIMRSKPIIKGKNDKINELIKFLNTWQEIIFYIERRLNDKT